jgi:uridylate kinase
MGVETAIVIGGGNIFRGVAASARGHGPGDRRLHGHAGDRHQRASRCRTRSSSRTS